MLTLAFWPCTLQFPLLDPGIPRTRKYKPYSDVPAFVLRLEDRFSSERVRRSTPKHPYVLDLFLRFEAY